MVFMYVIDNFKFSKHKFTMSFIYWSTNLVLALVCGYVPLADLES